MFTIRTALLLLLIYPVQLLAQSNKAKKNVGKIIFATQPFTNGNVTPAKNFASSNFIYAQLVTNGSSFYEFLTESNGTPADKSKTYPLWYLYYVVKVYKKREQIGSPNSEATCTFTNISWDTKTLNIDVLPDPQNASTLIENQFINGSPQTVPLYKLIDASHFPESGNYKIKVEVYDETVDAWGKKTSKSNWPSFEGEFDFAFNSNDIATLKKNGEYLNNKFSAEAKAKKNAEDNARQEKRNSEYQKEYAEKVKQQEEHQRKTMEQWNAKEKADLEAKAMPKSWTAKSASSAAGFTIAQIKKAFIDHSAEDAQIAKIYIEPGGSWVISKNNLGIPIEQYFNIDINIFYKSKNQCLLRDMYLRKTYLGGGIYGNAHISVGASDEKLPCSKMK